LALTLALLALGACNRGGARIPGASTAFPETPIDFVAPAPVAATLRIAPALDQRSQHYGEPIADGRWKACRTDPLWTTSASEVVGARLRAALEDARVFTRVHVDPASDADLVLVPEIHAFCSHAVGFVYLRVAGVSAIRLRVQRGDETLFDRRFERVVTDADPEYTGSQVAMIEQAMQRTLADSLRELLREAIPRVADEAKSWGAASPQGQPLSLR
jgi:hypothetical protein